MDTKRIALNDIVVGQPLPWDVMDASGNLLLRKGYIIDKQSQAELLVERGMFVDAKHTQKAQSATAAAPVTEKPSALLGINRCIKRLDQLLHALPQLPEARAKIMEVVKMLMFSADLAPDLALATIMVNQQAGAYAVRHCVDTAVLALLVAKAMGKPNEEIEQLVAASLTMNVGMLNDHNRLFHSNAPLSEADRALIRHHPYKSIEMLHEAGIEDPAWLSYILFHHEHEDGSGYPVGVVNCEIPPCAKLLALADGYCARVTSRGYRKSVLPNVALRDIFIECGAKVDALLGAYFVKVLGLYPPGCFVRLKNGEIGLVSARGAGPADVIAHALVKPNGEAFAMPMQRDTQEDAYAIVEGIHPSKASVRFGMHSIWGDSARI